MATKFYLNSDTATTADGYRTGGLPGEGGVVYTRNSTPDADGDFFAYAEEATTTDSAIGYVHERFLSETPPASATVPAPKVEVVEEVVTSTKKTVVLRLTEEEARHLHGLLGPMTGLLTWAIFSPLDDALNA